MKVGPVAHTYIVPASEKRLRQEDYKLVASLGYRVKPRCNNNNNKNNLREYGLVVEHMSSMTEGLGVLSPVPKKGE